MVKKYNAPIDIAKVCSAISNLGSTWQACWENLLAGKRSFSVGRDVIPGWPQCPPVSAITDFGHFPGQPVFSQRFSQLMQCVGLDLKPVVDSISARHPNAVISVVLASSAGDPGALHAMVDAHFGKGGPSEPITSDVTAGILGPIRAAPLNKGLGRSLPSACVFGACASALVAISHASDRINAGLSDVVLVVALDTLSRVASIGFKNIGASAPCGATPYARTRSGTTVGEGAVGLILARPGILLGDEIAAHVAGTAVCCDAAHLVEPNPAGVASVVTQAMAQAGVTPQEIAGVYWHGTGTRQNDKTESAVSALVFGAMSAPSTSTKGGLGHTMGASGGFNVLSACKTFETGLMPHIAGTTDPEFDNMDLVIGKARHIKRGPALITALGFGGINAATVLVPKDWSAAC